VAKEVFLKEIFLLENESERGIIGMSGIEEFEVFDGVIDVTGVATCRVNGNESAL
jgi:hypothetical protein